MLAQKRAVTLLHLIKAIWLPLVLWVALFFAPGMPSALADNSCSVPANACACTTCGCGATGTAPRCPEGQQPYDDYCLPACPDGWLRYPGYPGLCTPPCEHGCPEGYEQVPLPQCPEGYHRDIQNPDSCVPDYEPSQDDCPTGMVLSPNTLQCVTDCPDGTYRDGEGLCRSYYQENCPAGYSRDPQSGQCVPPGTWPSGYQWICLPQCPPGTQRDFYHPTRCVPPEPQCTDGYESYNGRCLPPCEEGSQRDTYGYCVPKQCPPGTYTNLRGDCSPPECPQGYDTVRGQCVPPCEEGLTRDENGRCVPPDAGCPEGTETFRGTCLPPCTQGYTRDRQTGTCMPPDDGCRQGQEKYRGQCVPLCKTGQVRDAKGRCVNPGCPTGTETYKGSCLPLCRKDLVRLPDGSCGCPQGESLVNGRCLPPCDNGQVRDKNGRCVTPSCPDGEERVRGRCVPECFANTIRDSRGRCVCPKGTEMSTAGRCEKMTYDEGGYDCGKGYHRDGDGNCVPDRRVQTQCPEGYRYSKKRQTCVPDKDGQNKLQINPDTLQLLQPRQKNSGSGGQQSCPKGYIPDGNGGCMRGQ